MDARERWQALQAKLTIARTQLEQGNRLAALEAVEAALAIDPEFLAAHALRDRIRAAASAGQVSSFSSTAQAASAVALCAQTQTTVTSPPAPAAAVSAPPAMPLVSAERYATFEQRAKRRRVDRRLDAARDAIARGHVRDAAAALEEVRELDPNVPELPELTAKFDALQSGGSSRHTGRWVAAAAAFVLVVIGASSMQKVGGLVYRRVVEPPTSQPVATLVSTAAAEPAAAASSTPSVRIETAVVHPVATMGAGFVPVQAAPDSLQALEDTRARAIRDALARIVDSRPANAVVPAAVPAAVSGVTEPIGPPVAPPPVVPPTTTYTANASAAVNAVTSAPLATPPPAPVPTPAAALPQAPVAPPNVAPVSAAVVMPNDEVLVKQVLQRYRSAYEGLDARSARAVWPAVNETALARAFDSLESQSLTFENCNVSLNGVAAAATCRGSARYVPKVGSHEPRVEPRTWNFTLRKNGPEWTIESARAERSATAER